ncbi:MAG: universal stress protein [Anaerolineales bacterium]|nr:universal stress protein [Anaerolineales bacterium]
MSGNLNITAAQDFQEARRKADLQEFLARLTGKTNELLSYEEVRQKLRAREGARIEIRDIPLDAIIGSVGRYTDFTRNFLPRRDANRSRWAAVMEKAVGLQGLPPIDVYQIGEAYFVLDGNHRVSVARQLGASHIQARVTPVKTRVPLSPEVRPDELILKAEYVAFLEETGVDRILPQADFTVTSPGQYPILEEHIAVHRYFMGLDQQQEIPYAEAVQHWYEDIYQPVVEMMREKGILRHFPERTEADFYLWISRHQAELAQELNWQIDTGSAADDLLQRYGGDLGKAIGRVTGRILDALLPDGLESGPPTGTWRRSQAEQKQSDVLFPHILVGISKDDAGWQALNQAILIGQREGSQLHGLHVLPESEQVDEVVVQNLKDEFLAHCKAAGLTADFAVEFGSAARRICERAHWTDLIIGTLTHPPQDGPLERLSSGFRIMVRRCSRPILALPGQARPIGKLLLAYNGSPKADEALYIATYLAGNWQVPLTVLTIEDKDINIDGVQARADEYLAKANLSAHFESRTGPVAATIVETAAQLDTDLILIGGYRANPLVEVLTGSIVDQILRRIEVPTLISR